MLKKTSAIFLFSTLCGAHEIINSDVEDFRKAILNAKVCFINTPPLLAIKKNNSSLIFNTNNNHVLVTTWISPNLLPIFEPFVGKKFTTSLNRNMWVTLVPEVKNFCRAYAQTIKQNAFFPAVLARRVGKFLGLTPHNYLGEQQIPFFVEAWVQPSDLVRPCMDGEVDDDQCNVDLQCESATPEHKAWIEYIKQSTAGHPWTALGYTFDWGAAGVPFGASEYLVRRGAVIEIRAIISTTRYCDQPKTCAVRSW